MIVRTTEADADNYCKSLKDPDVSKSAQEALEAHVIIPETLGRKNNLKELNYIRFGQRWNTKADCLEPVAVWESSNSIQTVSPEEALDVVVIVKEAVNTNLNLSSLQD